MDDLPSRVFALEVRTHALERFQESDREDDSDAVKAALQPYDVRLKLLERIAWIQFVAVLGTAAIVVWQSLINPPRPIPAGTIPYQQERAR